MNKTVSIITHIRYERLVVWVECVVLAMLFSAYAYFLVASVVDVVLHKETLVSTQETENKISQLESEYFTHLNTLTPDVLSVYGLEKQSPIAYVTVSSPAHKFTKRD